MPTIIDRMKNIWDSAVSAPAKTRANFAIDPVRVVGDGAAGEPFRDKQHYFQIVINQMYLADEREWFVRYDPLTFVISSYIYDTRQEVVPFVVGPALLKEHAKNAPTGMVFQDTPVSGMHPYQGGSLTLTVILNKLARENNADKLLKVVEKMSTTFSPSILSSGYLTMASTLIDGVEAILGLDETTPIIGYRVTINPDTGAVFRPSHFVIIDEDEQEVDKDKFWVVDNRLHYGDDDASARPYNENDFVLFSITQGTKRTDERTLPFYPMWETARDLAARPEPHYWNEAKSNFNTLKRSVLKSPDLTQPDAARLMAAYFEELKKRREEAALEGDLAPKEVGGDEKQFMRIAQELDKLDHLS
ncbi:MAG TPA: hypothetical protein VIW80_19650 [Pyrinomonadaceae bacterium]